MSARANSRGSAVSRSDPATNLQVASDDRLPPSEVTVPGAKQSSADMTLRPLLATIEFAIVSEAPVWTWSPVFSFEAIVECVIVPDVPDTRMTAGPPRLPTTVTFSRSRPPAVCM